MSVDTNNICKLKLKITQQNKQPPLQQTYSQTNIQLTDQQTEIDKNRPNRCQIKFIPHRDARPLLMAKLADLKDKIHKFQLK